MIQFIIDNYAEIISGVVATLGGLYVLACIIPGEQPDKFLKGAADFLSKFSLKKK